MEDKRIYNYKKHTTKFNELNNFGLSYFKSKLENEKNYEKVLEEIMKFKSRFQKYEKKNNYNDYNSNSPSFRCDRAKSMDINNNNTLKNNNNINNYNSKNTTYKRPRHYINNKTVDYIKNKNNNRYNNINKANNSKKNYNTYSKLITPVNKTQDGYSSYSNNLSSNNIVFSKINPNDEFIKKESYSYLVRDNSFDNIFTKIPTNISRIKKKSNEALEQSSETSFFNNNNFINNNNYHTINMDNNNLNNDYLVYNSTFYNNKDLSVEMPKNNNNNSINNNIANNNNKIKTKIYYKTPIIKRQKLNNKRNERKKNDDYFTYNKNTNNDILNLEKVKKEDYFSNYTASTNTFSNANNINTINTFNNQQNNQRFNNINKYQINRYKDYIYAYNIQNGNSLDINKNLVNNNKKLIEKEKENKKSSNLIQYDNKIHNNKSLSSYIMKEQEDNLWNYNNRKYATKSYDNTIFKQRIKIIKKKKKIKRIRKKTFDDIPIDRPSATPIDKEKDKGGKVDLKFNINYNCMNKSGSQKFNHQIDINIKYIKTNLKKIILIQKWWKNILQKKIISINDKFNKYKKEKSISKSKNRKINIHCQKRYLNRNKYNTVDLNNIKKISITNDTKEDINDNLIKKKIIQNYCYAKKINYKNKNSYIIFLQKYIRHKLLNKKYKNKSFDLTKLVICPINKFYFDKNENKYKIENLIYNMDERKTVLKNKNKNELIYSLPLKKNCFISKMYYLNKVKKDLINCYLQNINESHSEYFMIMPKKPNKIQYNKNNEIISNINNKNILNNKLDKNINSEDTIKLPKSIVCHISKINSLKYKNNKIKKYPLINKCSFITKICKNNDKINLIIFLQKYIINYIKNKKNNDKIYLNYFRPSILNCYISKKYKTNITNDLNKIRYIQKKYKDFNTRSIRDSNHNNNEIKSLSSNDNTSQISKKSNEHKNQNINEIKHSNDLNKNSINNKRQISDLIQNIIQKISKNINQYMFYKIKNAKMNKNENIFFLIIKRIINIYNTISKNKNKNEYNEFLKLISGNLSKNINELKKYNFLLFIPKKEEDNLIKTQLFISNDKILVNFISECLKIEYNLINNDNINKLIQYRLKKEPLNDYNIFTIVRYIDMLYENIINNNICFKCFCKQREKCPIRCKCHHSTNLNYYSKLKFNTINGLPERKTKTQTLNYSFDEINSNNLYNNRNNDIEIISNVLLYDRIFKRNIYYCIEKVDKLNHSVIESGSEIDVFQKINEGSESLITKEIINNIFDEYKKEKYNINNIFSNEENENTKKIRHISKLSSTSEIVNVPNCEEEDLALNKIKDYFEENK